MVPRSPAAKGMGGELPGGEQPCLLSRKGQGSGRWRRAHVQRAGAWSPLPRRAGGSQCAFPFTCRQAHLPK